MADDLVVRFNRVRDSKKTGEQEDDSFQIKIGQD